MEMKTDLVIKFDDFGQIKLNNYTDSVLYVFTIK